MNGNRKPFLVVAVCAAAALLVLVTGVSCSGQNDAGAKRWQDSLADFARGGPLTMADLELTTGTCTVEGARLKVTGSCAFEVKEFSGPLGLGPPTKRATLVPQEAVVVDLLVQGTRINQDVKPGKDVPLTFGTSGGEFRITCPSLSGCTLQLFNGS